MRKNGPILLILAVSCVLSVSLSPLTGSTQEAPTPRARVDLVFRSAHPGEVVRLDIRAPVSIKKALISFQGQRVLSSRGRDRTEMLAFIGLDLSQKPGSYPIELILMYEDGTQDSMTKRIDVVEKSFPQKKLWVDQAFVTPPASVLERIRRESELVRSVYEIRTPQWLGEGRFIIPVNGELVPNFGERRIFNEQPRSPHSGIDISSPTGMPVKASNSGRVVLASDLYYSGQTVILDHGIGVFSLYCHFSRIRVERGEFVLRGDFIGEIGATGRVTGPHLHWAFKVHGSRVDPLSLVALAGEE